MFSQFLQSDQPWGHLRQEIPKYQTLSEFEAS